MNIKVLIIDDHQILRTGLNLIMQTTEEITVVGEASNGIQGIEKVKKLNPDVILTDIRMPEMDGITMIETLNEMELNIPVVVLTTFDDQEPIQKALQLSVKGFILKDSKKEVIIQVVKDAYNGQMYLEPSLVKQVIAIPSQKDVEFSKQDKQILQMVAKGYRNKDIAETIHLSERTIKNHLTRIYDKLDVFTRAEAVAKALNLGVIEL